MPEQTACVLELPAELLAARALRDGNTARRDLAGARRALEEAQSGDGVARAAAEVEDLLVAAGELGSVQVRIFRPKPPPPAPLPAVLYAHGPTWTLGSLDTHDRLMRELAVGAQAAIVLAEHTLAPEARYPVALQQYRAVARWIATEGHRRGLDARRVAVAGDGTGATLATALTLAAGERTMPTPTLAGQLLLGPACDATMGSGSHRLLADHYPRGHTTMRSCWEQYAIPAERKLSTVSPLRATPAELTGAPPALVITAEADVLRDEGETYAAQLRAAGVPVTAVRYTGTIADFTVLDALRDTNAARGALTQATTFLRDVLATTEPPHQALDLRGAC
jgi:acetyl esterase